MSAKPAIFLDSNAGAPLRPEAVEALRSLLSTPDGLLGNPSSVHQLGRKARARLSGARENIAKSIGANLGTSSIIFTSSGTEANQLAIRSALAPWLVAGKKPRWITTRAEHEATLSLIPELESQGIETDFLELDSQGQVSPSDLDRLRRPETALLSILWANNETGVLQPIDEIARVCQKLSLPLHIDAAQAWGKLPVKVQEIGAQWVSFSGHKIGAPAGTGLLWTPDQSSLHPVMPGKQEQGKRSGTENLLGLVALGAAAGALRPDETGPKLSQLRDRLEAWIVEHLPEAKITSAKAPRVPNTLHLRFPGLKNDSLVAALDLEGYAVSAGSACSSGVLAPSHVLQAMGLSNAEAQSGIRISLPEGVHWEPLERFANVLGQITRRMRKE